MKQYFYIKAEGGTYSVASIETRQSVTVDMSLAEAVGFLEKMMTIKARSLRPAEPRLYYNRAEN
jgi:hypothetical protein